MLDFVLALVGFVHVTDSDRNVLKPVVITAQLAGIGFPSGVK